MITDTRDNTTTAKDTERALTFMPMEAHIQAIGLMVRRWVREFLLGSMETNMR
jgi:hypothetical protein